MRVKITYNNIFVQFESQHMPMFYIYCSFLLQIILFQGEIKTAFEIRFETQPYISSGCPFNFLFVLTNKPS